MALLLIIWQIGKRLTDIWSARNGFGKTFEDNRSKFPIPSWSVFVLYALVNQ